MVHCSFPAFLLLLAVLGQDVASPFTEAAVTPMVVRVLTSGCFAGSVISFPISVLMLFVFALQTRSPPGDP